MKKITKQILVLTLGLSALTSLALFAYDAPADPPGRPGKPRVLDYDREWCKISWAVPVHDGGSPIVGYDTEKKRVLGLWQDSGSTIADVNFHTIRNLEAGKTYKFRVIASNAIGKGEPSEVSEPIEMMN